MVPLGEIATFIRGVTFKPGDVADDGVGVMRTKNVQVKLDCSDIIRIPATLVKRTDQYLREGDMLVSSANSWSAVGKACWVPRLPEPLAIGGFVTALRTASSETDPRYLYRWFTQPMTQAKLRSFSNQTTNISNLNLRLASAMPVPLPPLPEQRRIAAILDHADALRAKRRQVLAHLDSVIPSVFNEVLTGAAFPSKPLAEVAETWDCPHSTPRWTSAGSICLRTPNLTRGGWNWDDTRYVDEAQFKTRSKGGGAQPGDIILSREGTVGIAAIVQPGLEACMGQRLVQVRPDPAVLHPQWALEFLLTALHPERISRVMVGSTAQHLNVKDLRALTVPTPPMDVQLALAERAESLRSVRESAERANVAHDELFASLQSRAFDGRL